jgi:hypothetical protein
MSQFESTSKHSDEQNYAASPAHLTGVDPHAAEMMSFPRRAGEAAELASLAIPSPSTLAHDAPSEVQPGSIPSKDLQTSPKIQTRSKVLSISYFTRDMREAVEGATKKVDSWCSGLGLSGIGKILVGASTALGAAAAFAATPVEAAGVAAIGLWQVSQFYRTNRHSRAVSMLAGSLYTSHMTAMGFQAAAMCSFAATCRSLMQSMVADDRPLARAAMAAGLFAATAAVHTTVNNEYPRLSLENIPLITLALSSIAGAFPERLSWASRLTTLGCMSLALGYHSMITQSSIAFWANATLLPGALLTIWRYDIARP